MNYYFQAINAVTRINELVDQRAAEAQAEMKAMGESARRSIGQLLRKDNREARAGKPRRTLSKITIKESADRFLPALERLANS